PLRNDYPEQSQSAIGRGTATASGLRSAFRLWPGAEPCRIDALETEIAIAFGRPFLEQHSMSTVARPIVIATRGSALALAQANFVFDQCRAAFPKLKFEIKILKTTGDKLQTVSLARPAESLPKGLFTK